MSATEDSEFAQSAELLLKLRLGKLQGVLASRFRAIEREAAARGRSEEMVRGLMVNAGTALLEIHAERDLTDLLGLMRTFDALPSESWLAETHEAHVEAVANGVIRKLSESLPDGDLSTAELQKMAKMIAKIKSKSSKAIGPAVTDAIRRQAIAASDESDLDDRLPLKRPRSFDHELKQMSKSEQRRGEPLTLAMIDLDHFKKLNQEHGHLLGDEVLLGVAEVVVKRLGRKGTAYHCGGQAFALLLPGYSAEEGAGLSERIRKDVERTPVTGENLSVTASFGIATIPDHANDARTLLESAGTALYEAKNAGRNRVRIAEK